MPTNYPKHSDPTEISKHIALPPEEKKKLPAPELLSDVYESDGSLCIDIRDHEGKCWTLAAPSSEVLRKSLRYFKTLDRAKIEDVLPPSKMPMRAWRKMAGILCAKCGEFAKRKPTKKEVIYGCVVCVTEGPLGELFVNKPNVVSTKVPKEAEAKPVAPVEVPKTEPSVKPVKKRVMQTNDPKPLAGLSIADRLKAKKEKE